MNSFTKTRENFSKASITSKETSIKMLVDQVKKATSVETLFNKLVELESEIVSLNHALTLDHSKRISKAIEDKKNYQTITSIPLIQKTIHDFIDIEKLPKFGNASCELSKDEKYELGKTTWISHPSMKDFGWYLKEVEPPHQEVEPPHQEVEPPHQEVEPPHQEVEPPITIEALQAEAVQVLLSESTYELFERLLAFESNIDAYNIQLYGEYILSLERKYDMSTDDFSVTHKKCNLKQYQIFDFLDQLKLPSFVKEEHDGWLSKDNTHILYRSVSNDSYGWTIRRRWSIE